MAATKPRKPQDHQWKKLKKPKPEVVQVEDGWEVTVTLEPRPIDPADDESGEPEEAGPRKLTVTVPRDALDDFELLDDLASLKDLNDASRLPSMLRKVVGDQYGTVMDALRSVNGRVRIEDGQNFLMDVFGAINPNS